MQSSEDQNDDILIGEVKSEDFNWQNSLFSQNFRENEEIVAQDQQSVSSSDLQCLKQQDKVQGYRRRTESMNPQNLQSLKFEKVSFFQKVNNSLNQPSSVLPSNDAISSTDLNNCSHQRRQTSEGKYQQFKLVFKSYIFKQSGYDVRKMSKQRSEFFYSKIIERMTAVLIEQSEKIPVQQARSRKLFLYEGDARELGNLKKSRITSQEKYFYLSKPQYLHDLLSFKFKEIDKKDQSPSNQMIDESQSRGPNRSAHKKSARPRANNKHLVGLIFLPQLTKEEFQKVFNQMQLFEMIINSDLSQDHDCCRRIYYASLIIIFKRMRYDDKRQIHKEWERFWKGRQNQIDKQYSDLTSQQRLKRLKQLCTPDNLPERGTDADENLQLSSHHQQQTQSILSINENCFRYPRSAAYSKNSSQVIQMNSTNQKFTNRLENYTISEDKIQKQLPTKLEQLKQLNVSSQASNRKISSNLGMEYLEISEYHHSQDDAILDQLLDSQQIINRINIHSLDVFDDRYNFQETSFLYFN